MNKKKKIFLLLPIIFVFFNTAIINANLYYWSLCVNFFISYLVIFSIRTDFLTLINIEVKNL